jgi:hypothetical protein
MISTAKIFVGVDVSKETLDVYRPDTKEVFKIENSDEAIALNLLIKTNQLWENKMSV